MGVYAASSTEASLDLAWEALWARGTRLAFPRVGGDGLGFFEVPSLDGLVPGFRGIREPPAGAVAVPAEALELLVVPALGVDRDGNRLGQGGGHYDRFLAGVSLGGPVVGVGFAVQLTAQRVPTGPLDVGVDAVLTETQWVATSRWTGPNVP